MGKKIYLTIIWFLVLLAMILGIGHHVFGWNEKEEETLATGALSDTIEVDAFTSIDVDVASVTFALDQSGDSYKVEYTTNKEKYIPSISVKGNTLMIQQPDMKLSDLTGTKNPRLTLTVYVPKDTEFDEISFDVGACDFELSDVTSHTIDFDSGAGDISMKDCVTNTISVDTGAGNTELKNVEFNTLDIDSGAGNVDVSGVGDANEYSYDIDLGVGKLSINGNKLSKIGSEYKVEGTTDKKIHVDAGTGNVAISD